MHFYSGPPLHFLSGVDNQAILQGLVGALDTAFCLRRVGAKNVDVEGVQRPSELGHAVALDCAGAIDPKDVMLVAVERDRFAMCLEPNEITRELRRKRVTVIDYPDGRLAIRYRGLDLPYTPFDKLQQVAQATIVENKHLGAVLSHIRDKQIERAEARSQSAPRRQGQVGHMFKVG